MRVSYNMRVCRPQHRITVLWPNALISKQEGEAMNRIARNPFETSIPNVMPESPATEAVEAGGNERGQSTPVARQDREPARKNVTTRRRQVASPGPTPADGHEPRPVSSAASKAQGDTGGSSDAGPDDQANREGGSVYMTPGLWNRVRNPAYWRREKLSEIFEWCVDQGINATEEENGRPFRQRRSRLKTGRPMK